MSSMVKWSKSTGEWILSHLWLVSNLLIVPVFKHAFGHINAPFLIKTISQIYIIGLKGKGFLTCAEILTFGHFIIRHWKRCILERD